MNVNSEETAIEVKNLVKSFRLPIGTGHSVKNRLLGRVKRGHLEFTPLNGVSFTINKGDFFGIVGRNGSGKSTLLKTIAGIYQPTNGKVDVRGKLVPFIELGVGFNPELSGRDNVYLNMALLGFSRKETDELYSEIVDFAELHDFMEERLLNYSSGMQVRLAFSIAVRSKGDILLLDEVLAVGDVAFQQKCYNYFRQLKEANKTVVLVTHNMSQVEEFCNRGLLLNNGKIEAIGSSEEVANAYRELFKQANDTEIGPSSQIESQPESVLDLGSVELVQGGKATHTLKATERFEIAIKARLKDLDYHDFNFSVDIRNSQDLLLVSTSYGAINEDTLNFTEDKVTIIGFKVDNILANGSYYINIKARAKHKNNDSRKDVANYQKVATFVVEGRLYHLHSLAYPKIEAYVKTSEGS